MKKCICLNNLLAYLNKNAARKFAQTCCRNLMSIPIFLKKETDEIWIFQCDPISGAHVSEYRLGNPKDPRSLFLISGLLFFSNMDTNRVFKS